MDLQLDYSLGKLFKSNTQKMRIITESWVAQNSYCPICGESNINHYQNNRPVADFYCEHCNSDFELKSKEFKSGIVPHKIADGSYDTMVSRLTSNNNPHFLFLVHNNQTIRHYFLVPKYFIVPQYIEKRNPLSSMARRAGWIGCNINLQNIPLSGMIFLINDSQTVSKDFVLKQYNQAQLLIEESIEKRGWILEVLKCVERIDQQEFSLKTVYAFQEYLQELHKNNHCIEAKIRQQLQILRNKGIIEFLGRGQYRKRG